MEGAIMLEQLPLLNGLPDNVRATIVQLLLVVLALAIIWILRRAITWILVRPLRGLVRKSSLEIDDLLFEALTAPIRYFIVAAGLLISLEILSADAGVTQLGQHIARSLIIIGMFLILYRLVDVLTPNANRLFHITGITIEERLLPFTRTAIKMVIMALALVIVIQEWGYDVSGLVAGLGLFGLAFSLAAKDTAENLFGFVAIVGDSPFNEGEFIVTPDVTGTIEHVGMRSTRVRQLDQALVTVPNSKLAQSAILNWSRLEKRRISKTIGVTYSATSADLRLLGQRIREMLKARETVDPESVIVNFVDFGDSSLDVLVIAMVMLADWSAFTAEKEAIYLEIMDIVADLGMSIAFPSRSLYIEQMPGTVDLQRVVKREPLLGPEEAPHTNPDYADLSNESGTNEPDMPDQR
jgi:MscS family membrane protein